MRHYNDHYEDADHDNDNDNEKCSGIEKHIPIASVIAILLQLVVWAAIAGIAWERISNQEQRVTEYLQINHEQDTAISQLNDRASRLEERVLTLTNRLNNFKK